MKQIKKNFNNNDKIRASVALAAYNGAKYILEQIVSIQGMISDKDEIVVSYEESSDDTLEILERIKEKDERIRIVFDKGSSVESNFNNAVKYCRGSYIFFSDQDDVWINNKIEKMIAKFEENDKNLVVICDGYETDHELKIKETLFKRYHIKTGGIRNLIKGTYLGCQMAMRKNLAEKIWPVSVEPPLPHDLWTGVMGAMYGNVVTIDEKLILHRLHNNNYSNASKMNINKVIRNRIYFAYMVMRNVLDNLKRDKRK